MHAHRPRYESRNRLRARRRKLSFFKRFNPIRYKVECRMRVLQLVFPIRNDRRQLATSARCAASRLAMPRMHLNTRLALGPTLRDIASPQLLGSKLGSRNIQGISIRRLPGLVNFVPALDHLICHNLPAAFSQPGNGLTEIPCKAHSVLSSVRSSFWEAGS